MEQGLRRLKGAGEFFRLFGDVFHSMQAMGKISKKEKIRPELSEKLMLAVSGVNQCAACSFRHTRTALEKGLSEGEIRGLLAGDWSEVPEEELPALLYGQHFAESRGAVSAEAREAFVQAFGEDKARQMEGYIKAVYFGNLCCNTVETRRDPKGCGGGQRPGWLVTLLARPVAGVIRRGTPRR